MRSCMCGVIFYNPWAKSCLILAAWEKEYKIRVRVSLCKAAHAGQVVQGACRCMAT